jgi:hypothetical protein
MNAVNEMAAAYGCGYILGAPEKREVVKERGSAFTRWLRSFLFS